MATATTADRACDHGITITPTGVGPKVMFVSATTPDPLVITIGEAGLTSAGISKTSRSLHDEQTRSAMLVIPVNDQLMGVMAGVLSRDATHCRLLEFTSTLFTKAPTGELIPRDSVSQTIWRCGAMGWPIPSETTLSDRELFAQQVAPGATLTNEPLHLELQDHTVCARLLGFAPNANFSPEGSGIQYSWQPLPDATLRWECVSFPLVRSQGRGMIVALTAVEHDGRRSVLSTGALRCADIAHFGKANNQAGQAAWVEDGGLTHCLRNAGHREITVWGQDDLTAALNALVEKSCL